MHRVRCPFDDRVIVGFNASFVAAVVLLMAYAYRKSRQSFRTPNLHACLVIVIEVRCSGISAVVSIHFSECGRAD